MGDRLVEKYLNDILDSIMQVESYFAIFFTVYDDSDCRRRPAFS